jgi:RHH-type proline utilization regulon transcriptional repressor/proline dehydrogenase/delta 1-pyrroline-5-carboxylate dehydrogenase
MTRHFNPADDLSAAQLAAVEFQTQELGQQLFASLKQGQPHIWQRRWWDEKLLAWTMRDEGLKVQLFRFVDVLPMLHSAEAVTDHLHEYLADVKQHLPAPARVALNVTQRMPFTKAAVARAARLSARDMARRFIAGETQDEVVRAAKRERSLHRAFTLDILGEAVLTEKEAEQHFRDYLDLVENLAPQIATWPADALVDQDDRGPIPRLNLSIKLSALDSQFDAIDPAGTLARVGPRLRELFRTAMRLGAFINVDMESYEKKTLTLHIFRAILSEP